MAVVGYHAFPGKVQGGFIGVDIFFVISGFLISTIIFSSFERDRFSLAEFYIRRIRRIFPSLIVVMLATLAFGWYVLLADEFAQLGKHLAGGAGFISNFILWNESGYFDRAAVAKPFLHLWSLGIEEQFYIFWPLLLAFVWKRHRNFVKITVLIAVSSFAVNIYLINTDQVASFYSPVSRFWELMIGGILAYIALHRPHLVSRYKNAQSVLGFILIGSSLVLLEKSSAFPGWWALLPAMGTFFIISAGPRVWLNEKLLTGRVMIWIGLISYPLYLWHWSLLSFAHIMENGVVTREVRIAAVVLAMILAWLTYQFIEKPVRFGMHKILMVSILLFVMSCILVAGVLGYKGLISPRNNNASLAKIIKATKDWEYPGSLESFDPVMKGAYVGKSERQEITLFMGDSHMEQYGPRIARVIQDNPSGLNTAVFVTDGGCVFIPNVFEDSPRHRRCGEVREYALNMSHRDAVKTVVIGGAWVSYFYALHMDKENAGSAGYYFLDHGKKVSLRSGHGVQLALNSLEGLVRKLSKTKKVYLLMDNPSGVGFDPHSFFSGDRLGGYFVNGSMTGFIHVDSQQSAIRKTLMEMADRFGLGVIDPVPTLCKDGNCLRALNGKPIYKDGSHLRASFVRDHASYIDKSMLVP